METLSLFSSIDEISDEEERLWVRYEGEWLPITWIPATTGEIAYMRKVQTVEGGKNARYIKKLQKI